MTDADHACDTPFWGTSDGRWTCADCGQMFAWTRAVRTVPGVPASVCIVHVNWWERVGTATRQLTDAGALPIGGST